MDTDLSGNMSRPKLRAEEKRILGAFPAEVQGMMNSRPTRTELALMPRKNFFVLTTKTPVNRGCFGEQEWRELPRWLREAEHWFGGEDAYIFPHHNLVIIKDETSFERRGIEGEGILGHLGYTVSVGRKDNLSTKWGNENKIELLCALRNKDIPVSALDRRAIEIVEGLTQGISTEGLTYCFGIFNPGAKREIRDTVGYEEIIASWFAVQPVKRLVEDVPSSWATRKLEELSTGLPLTRAIGLTSRVETSKGVYHIPQIDFAPGVMAPPLSVVEQLGMPGMVVNSGNSTHFYGFKVLDNLQWREFMETLKEIPEVDPYWPKLQLLQGYSMLRITPSKTKLTQPCVQSIYKSRQRGDERDETCVRRETSPIAIAA